MAVTKLYHLDEQGTQTLATYLLRCTNSRIKERILTEIGEGAASDNDHVLSAAAILGAIGTTADTSADNTVYGYVNGQVANINAAIGETTDTASDGTVYGYVNGEISDLETSVNNTIGTTSDTGTDSTVYGYINGQVANINSEIGTTSDAGTDNTVYGYVNGQVADINAAIGETTDTASDGTVYGYVNGQVADLEALIGGLTHLTYQEVVGPISSVQDPSETVLYLQRDEDAYRVGNDGYLLDSNGNHASYNDGENPEYEAWLDTSDNKIYKMVNGVKGAELASDDPIFDNVQKLADNTYNLYIWEKTSAEGVTPVTHKWVCVGDTSMELENYWSKKDADVAALQNLIIGSLTDQTVIAKVQAAWNATDPYANPSTDSYVPASWEE